MTSDGTVGELTAHRRGVVISLALLVAGPALWLSHLLIAYALVPLSCRIGSDLPLHAVTVAAAAGALASTAVAVQRWRSAGAAHGPTGATRRREAVAAMGRDALARGSEPGDIEPARDTGSLVAAVFALYFGVVVVMSGLVPIVVDRCA